MKALDLFCGYGGWTAGAHRTGQVNVVAALNHDEVACTAHSKAHPDTVHFQQDAGDFPFETLRNDLWGEMILASPSCRDFSTCGQPAKRGKGGNGSIDLAALAKMRIAERNTSWAVLEAIELLEPRVALIENVPPWLKWRLFPRWLDCLRDLGYTVEVHTLNAADYGGAVDRPRAIVTASKGKKIALSRSWGLGRAEGNRIYQYLDPPDEHRWYPIDSKPRVTRELIRTKQRESGLRFGMLNNVGDGVRMRPFDDLAPSPTRKTHSQLMIVADDVTRIIGKNELARLMGVRDHENHLPKTKEAAGFLLGNAIHSDFAEGIVTQTMEQL